MSKVISRYSHVILALMTLATLRCIGLTGWSQYVLIGFMYAAYVLGRLEEIL